MTFDFDFNTAETQAPRGDFELIPNGTIAKLLMTIRPGGEGPEGWLTRSKNSGNLFLSCEFVVTEGQFERRRFWQSFVLEGGQKNENGESIAWTISRSTLRSILESAKRIHPSDTSEKAMSARKVHSWEEFDGLEFAGKIGIEKGQGGYDDKNRLFAAITPNDKHYAEVMGGDMPAKAPTSKSRNPKPTDNTPPWAR
jgi:hypothetical protein